MTKVKQLIVEVHLVSLSAIETEERRERLRALLLRGALRFVQRQTATVPESVGTQLAPK